MTVIVWDGEILAADRRASCGDVHRSITKILPHEGELMAITGETALGLVLMAWYRDGAKPHAFPKLGPDDEVSLVVVKADGVVWLYEHWPVPIVFMDRKVAFGSGARYALGALEMGADSVQAVGVACKHSVSCGNGIDAYRLDGVKVQVG